MLFHFTITGLPRVFEPRVPETRELVECARILSARYGPDAVLWRYDPIHISSATDQEYHIGRFADLCSELRGSAKSCYFSPAILSGKVLRNAQSLKSETGIVCHDLALDDRTTLASTLADIAASHGIEMRSCCGACFRTRSVTFPPIRPARSAGALRARISAPTALARTAACIAMLTPMLRPRC